jgi:hypothetical protein
VSNAVATPGLPVVAAHPGSSTSDHQSVALHAAAPRRDVIEFLTYSLVGARVTPVGRTYSEVDGLVWALGSYVEKKGHESSTNFRLE